MFDSETMDATLDVPPFVIALVDSRQPIPGLITGWLSVVQLRLSLVPAVDNAESGGGVPETKRQRESTFTRFRGFELEPETRIHQRHIPSTL